MYNSLGGIMKLNRLAAAAAAVSVLCACSSVPKIKVNEREYETDTYIIKTQVPQFEGFSDSGFEEALNKEAEAFNENQISDFKMRLDDTFTSDKKAELTITAKECHQSKEFLSMYAEKSIFVSGIHPQLWRSSINIDMLQQKEVRLEEMFGGEDYIQFINARIDDVVNNNPDKYSDLWEKPQLTARSSTDFYIDNGYLVLYYQPYALSYYAKGVVEIPIKITALRGYIKEEYYNALKK